MKKCPECAEQVPSEARVCRYCGNDLPTKHSTLLKIVGFVGVLVVFWFVTTVFADFTP